MPTPVRFTSGFTQDNPGQFLANAGFPNPFFYHVWSTDLDEQPATLGTLTNSNSSGNFALTAGDGGLATLSTGATTPAIGDTTSFQTFVSSFQATPPKKLFFMARFSANLASAVLIRTGLMVTTTTPFTANPNGIYFTKAAGTTTITLQHVNGATVTSATVPAAAINFANNTFIDLGFELNSKGEIKVFAGTDTIGYRPQSGTATQPTPPRAGTIVARITPPAITTSLLSPTIAVQSSTAANTLLAVDLILAAKER